MSIRFLPILMGAMIGSGAMGQTVQEGYIKEYNERAQKTPLAGVELNVRSAQATISDKTGAFRLQFPTLKPGEKVNIRKIEKLGYEVFNKEAVEQWNINPSTPFMIVMCRSDKFKKIRDNYERISSRNYAQQLKKEEAQLTQLKAEGKLKEAEYQKALYDLREAYEKDLDNLANYVDRFSRIDLSDLSSSEQEIIDLVSAGKITEAIERYDRLNYAEKYKQEVKERDKIKETITTLSDLQSEKESSINSLLSGIGRQVETLYLAGGRDNIRKAGELLQEVAYADTTNASRMRRYALYLSEQNLDAQSVPVYKSVLRNPKSTRADSISAYYHLGIALQELLDPERAIAYLKKGLELLRAGSDNSENDDLKYLVALSDSYADRDNINEALAAIETAKKITDQRLQDSAEDEELSILYAHILNHAGLILEKKGDATGAIDYYKKSDKTIRTLNQAGSKKHFNNANLYLAGIYNDFGDTVHALQYIDQYIVDIEQEYQLKPLEYLPQISEAYTTKAQILGAAGDISGAKSTQRKSIEYLIGFETETGISLDWNLSVAYTSLSILHNTPEERNQAIGYMRKALDYTERMDNKGNADHQQNLARLYTNIASLYAEEGDLDNCLSYLDKAEKALELPSSTKIPSKVLQAQGYNNIGEIYRVLLGGYSKARDNYLKALEILIPIAKENPYYNKDIGQTYYNISASYLMEGLGAEAIANIDRAIEYDSENLHLLDGKGEVCMMLGLREEALKVWTRIKEIKPDINPNEIYFYGLLFPATEEDQNLPNTKEDQNEKQ